MGDTSGTREPRTRPRERDPDRQSRPNGDRHPERQRDRAGDRRRERSGGERRDGDRDRDRGRDRDPRQDRHVSPLQGDTCPRTPGLDERKWNTTSRRPKGSWNATNADTCARGEVWYR
ncbi:MARVEL domain containing 3 [Phyllostomus discolor]|uniref:MARVEL domain containing 3 n=1 Tax=Phyllostomus discolor TaxID=89673 RepID=A0A833YQ23_9CHIR|nr:MARVEL domain containing 3 [Phyllostomus discolor]